jgi:hypothetical protein
MQRLTKHHWPRSMDFLSLAVAAPALTGESRRAEKAARGLPGGNTILPTRATAFSRALCQQGFALRPSQPGLVLTLRLPMLARLARSCLAIRSTLFVSLGSFGVSSIPLTAVVRFARCPKRETTSKLLFVVQGSSIYWHEQS